MGRIFWRKEFQSTPPHGGRHSGSSILCTSRGFNPRPRMGGDAPYAAILQVSISFNPRPRMGGDRRRRQRRRQGGVSIHAPAWGATTLQLHITILPTKFQSTPPHGGRPCGACERKCIFYVSIHAPAWGATTLTIGILLLKLRFQSTPPHGGRQAAHQI